MLIDYRLDRATTLKPARKTEEGWEFEGFAARQGIYVYRNPDGSIRRELVDETTLSKSTSISGAPVTLHHPSSGRVDSMNREKEEVGTVRGEEIEANTGNLKVLLLVTREDANAAVQGGLRGLSPGYVVKLDSKPGVHPKFGAFDARQISRDYNHLAIVGGSSDPARGGSVTSLRVDAAIEISPEEATMIHLLSILALLPTRADAVDTSDEAAVAAATKGGVEALVAENSRLAGENEALRADAAKEDTTEADNLAWFTKRVELVEVAKRFNIDAIETLADDEIRKQVALKAYPNANADGDASYFRAMFDVASAQPARSDSAQIGRGIKPAEKPADRVDAKDDFVRPSAVGVQFIRDNGINGRA